MDKLIYCDKCGYFDQVKEILFDKCPRCNTPLIIDDIEADENIANNLIVEQLEEAELNIMREAINEIGSEMWNNIEIIKNPLVRIEKRKLFIKAGGIIPEKEIRI